MLMMLYFSSQFIFLFETGEIDLNFIRLRKYEIDGETYDVFDVDMVVHSIYDPSVSNFKTLFVFEKNSFGQAGMYMKFNDFARFRD